MLSTVGRVAPRRIATARIASSVPQLLSYSVPAAACPSIATRAFSVSAFTQLPAAKAFKKTIATRKKKGPVLKPARPGPPKKKLTPEEKEKISIRELRKWAEIPDDAPRLPYSPWHLHVSRNPSRGLNVVDGIKGVVESWKKLPSSQLEELKKTAQSNVVTNQANYMKWVESYPVERIYIANLARRRLEKKTGQKPRLINDHRVPKLPGNAYTRFFTAHYNTPDVNNECDTLVEKSKMIAKEWSKVSDTEKKSYEIEYQKELSNYRAQMKKIKADVKALQDAAKQAAEEEKQAKEDARDEARADRKAERLRAKARKLLEDFEKRAK